MASVRPMQLEGQYARAQLWKLDTIKGRTVPLSAMLAEYLMLPQFPSARFKAWVEQYDRLPDSIGEVVFHLLPDEEFPQHLSERARVECTVLKIIDGVRTWINYHGSVAQYMSQREAIFGDTVPTVLSITDWLTDEEQAYLNEWHNRYACPWPLVDGQWRPGFHQRNNGGGMVARAHPQLRGLYGRYLTRRRAWHESREYEPYNRYYFYVVVTYYDGEECSRRTYDSARAFERDIEAPGPDFWDV